MKILFGLHGTMHTEIAQEEINAFQKAGAVTEACAYGNWGVANGFINSLKQVFKNADNLKKKAAIQKTDIVYLNTALDIKTLVRDSITIFILKRHNKKIKIVLKFHGSESATVFSKRNLLKNYVFRKADLLLVLSNEERDNFVSVGVPADKVQVTANVIQKDLYVADPVFKAQLKSSEETGVLLFVGRFMHEKGILDLIEACRLLKPSHTDFQLFCLGNGPLVDEANRLITEYGLEKNVKLLGHIPENKTRSYYANCDILVLPTYHQEGFPMAVFQAVGAGKPVITTKIRAAADYLTANENCLWVEKKNPQQLYQQINTLINDKIVQEKMGRNNLILAEKFTAEKIVNKLLEYFSKI
jgi:glycosyltransferase involved in cell wall biosynthesis